MNIPEYNTELGNNVVSNLNHIIPGNNESFPSAYDYLYDNADNTVYNHTTPDFAGSQHLATILQQLFSKMSDNNTLYNVHSSSFESAVSSVASARLSPTSLSAASFSPLTASAADSYHLLSVVSLWFVLIVNPILILFGVVGNLLATYILINCNIAKFPVSFYTIMLNISDTLNLLIPVFIFWLDNCFNRTPERGYFRDKSNFLCKALMCPDQLFAALSAWYMCAISFNRWYSVCRPSLYFSRMSAGGSRATAVKGMNGSRTNNTKQKSSASLFDNVSHVLMPLCVLLNFGYCLPRHMKNRQHLPAFRSIAVITLSGILCCLYPIFMHELRPIISTNNHVFDSTQKITRTYPVIWKRCYYSRKHEYAYDIIGIILSCLLHILPLTFVAVMSLMIIVRLKQRQRLMSVSANVVRSPLLVNDRKIPSDSPTKKLKGKMNIVAGRKLVRFRSAQLEIEECLSPSGLRNTHKDQATLTELHVHSPEAKTKSAMIKLKDLTSKRHHSRDRTITIMLVSVALSYLILTLPYRLFWSYNVYIKRMYPERLNSSVYLLKMHYIDHVLRTIRNIHYSTTFVSFIFLSKTFRRKFQQLCIGKCLDAWNRLFRRRSSASAETTDHNPANAKRSELQRVYHRFNETIGNRPNAVNMHNYHTIDMEPLPKSTLDEVPSSMADDRMQEEGISSIIKFEHDNLSCDNDE